jgi:hypothetical protein
MPQSEKFRVPWRVTSRTIPTPQMERAGLHAGGYLLASHSRIHESKSRCRFLLSGVLWLPHRGRTAACATRFARGSAGPSRCSASLASLLRRALIAENTCLDIGAHRMCQALHAVSSTIQQFIGGQITAATFLFAPTSGSTIRRFASVARHCSRRRCDYISFVYDTYQPRGSRYRAVAAQSFCEI